LPVGPLRERSRGRIRVARRGSESTKRSVARASYRRKAHPDRPLARPLHGGSGDGGLGAYLASRSPENGGVTSRERATGVPEARPHEATPANIRGQFLRSGGSGRRRRETSCPSIHHGSVSTPESKVGREPRARVQVDRLVGGTGRSDVSRSATADLSFEEATRRADARGRWERGETVRHASNGTLQIREKQTTRRLALSRVRTRPKASRLEAVCALYGVHAPRAWSCGFFKAARRLGRSCGACRATSRRQRWDRRDRKALPAPKARRVSRR